MLFRSIRASPPSRVESDSEQSSTASLSSSDRDDVQALLLDDLEGGGPDEAKNRTGVRTRALSGKRPSFSTSLLRQYSVGAYCQYARAIAWQLPRAAAGLIGGRTRHRHWEQGADGRPGHRSHRGRRPELRYLLLRLFVVLLMLLGLIQLLILGLGLFEAFFPDDLEWAFRQTWPRGPSHIDEGLIHWPTDFTADIRPVACHSHNDYWRKEPLYSAIRVGCSSVEADVWLFEDELYVGHSVSSLAPNRTLRALYVNPLLDILEKQNPITDLHTFLDTPRNGVFDTDPTRTLVLLIDFKTDGEELLPAVEAQLEPLRRREYLTHFDGIVRVDGAVTVVATGNAPFALLTNNTRYRDIFFDAPLDRMASLGGGGSVTSTPSAPGDAIPTSSPDESSHNNNNNKNKGQGLSGHAPLDPLAYNPQNSYYASASFSRAIGYPWRQRLSASQLSLLRAQIRGAHARGLKVRYWGVPGWPRGLRNHLWRVLVSEGVDVLNVDKLRDAVRGEWSERGGGGWWGWFW